MPKSPEFSPSEDEPKNETQEELEVFDLRLNKGELNELLRDLKFKKEELEESASKMVRKNQVERKELLSNRAAVLGSIIGKAEGSQENEK
ncbi:MAG: hypothetical protein A2998_01020 [Candidatus Staskawiczbacteria bacterium RIFCSPLOWO2_01_FULL_37_25b]|uniref:Uncharacterized protein n=2 Tax=Candidatus Staskawicziibacteriota TaxID=1817916 RepID=A0A1G2HTR9_9BACT|nr:MAG: hypothetical protein A2812_03335 [Candidatus Staskawiczbacteria bacterium RIFCSPHIGHO2_01_FULL_36_16]OGZ71642.1 MAG: hypothetical protein A2998_01020 [Candidatus Staskawiczbacteria bacterium RIFCSPLOWO2_01_FULL_37_25b]